MFSFQTNLDADAMSDLIAASREGKLDVAKFLVTIGADVKAGDNKGWTALIAASFNGHADIAKFFTANGTDIINPTTSFDYITSVIFPLNNQVKTRPTQKILSK